MGYAKCGAPEQPVSDAYPALFDALAAAPSELAARADEDEDAITQNLLNEAMRRIRQSEYVNQISRVPNSFWKSRSTIALTKPWGCHQRTYARFLQGKLDVALEDVPEPLKREPQHFAALSGRVRILFSQGRIKLAGHALAEALEINPWLREKRMLNIEPLYEQTKT